MYWQRVDIEGATEGRSATGAVTQTWGVVHQGVEARVLPIDSTEQSVDWATPEESAHEVHLRGWWEVDPTMRVVMDDASFDIRRVIQPPPFGEPSTRIQCVLVRP